MRGRPPRGRPAVTPSTLMQEMQACIELIEVSHIIHELGSEFGFNWTL